MTKMNLLYVEDIAQFNVMDSGMDNPERVTFNYGQLAGRGVDVEGRVLLLSVSNIAKAMCPKERLLEEGYDLSVYPALQFMQWLKDKYEEVHTEEANLLGFNMLYREAAVKLDAIGHTVDTSTQGRLAQIYTFVSNIAQHEHTTQKLTAMTDKTDSELHGKLLETKQAIQETIETIVEAMDSMKREFLRAADIRRSYGTPIFPIEGYELTMGHRRILVEEPLVPGRPLYQEWPGMAPSGYPEFDGLMENVGRWNAIMHAKDLYNGLPWERAMELAPEPVVVLTDVYALTMFPELEEHDVRILNERVDVSGLELQGRKEG